MTIGPWPRRTFTFLPLCLALAVCLGHALLFGDWLVDDAGISYAYARNFAAGFGLVAQPGSAPVEGFSNPLWTLLASAAYLLRIMWIPWTPKVVAALCLAGTFAILWRDLERSATPRWLTALTLLLLAACTPFVVWSVSGLENALLGLLVAASTSNALALARDPFCARRRDVTAGALAAGLALTRPDAALYGLAYPAALVITGRCSLPCLARYGLGALPFPGYLAFRLWYFHDVVPNTFHAKAAPSADRLVDLSKAYGLIESAFGDAALVVLVLAALMTGRLLLQRALGERVRILMVYAAIAAASHLLMPADWMGEFRFATACFPLFYWLMAALTRSWLRIRPRRAPAHLVAPIVASLVVAQACLIFAARSTVFARSPTFPLRWVERYAGASYDRLASTAELQHASLLSPDMGAALLTSHLRIYDMAGLCDREIALVLGKDTAAYHHLIFDELKPTFIRTHGPSIRITRLYEAPAFHRDYVPIAEYHDDSPDWLALWQGGPAPPFRGEYVRADALRTSSLEVLKAAYAREGLQAADPWRRPPDRLREGWPQVRWALKRLAGDAPPF